MLSCTVLSNVLYLFFLVHCLYRFPREGNTLLVLNDPAEKQRWKQLRQNIINSMCRDVRNKEQKHREKNWVNTMPLCFAVYLSLFAICSNYSTISESHIGHYRVLLWVTGPLTSLESIAKAPDRQLQVAKMGKSAIFWLFTTLWPMGLLKIIII